MADTRKLTIGIEIPNLDKTTQSVDNLTKELSQLLEVEQELNKQLENSELGSQQQQDLVTSISEVNDEITKYSQTLDKQLPNASKKIVELNKGLEETRKQALEAFSSDRIIQFTGVASQALIGLNESFAQLSDGSQDATASIQRATQALVQINSIRDSAEALIGFKNIVGGVVTSLATATATSFTFSGALQFLKSVINPLNGVLAVLTGAFAYLVSISNGFTSFLDKITSGFKAIFSSFANGTSFFEEYNAQLAKIKREKKLTSLTNELEKFTKEIEIANSKQLGIGKTLQEVSETTFKNNNKIIGALDEIIKLKGEQIKAEKSITARNHLVLELLDFQAQREAKIAEKRKAKIDALQQEIESQKELNILQIDNQIKGVQRLQEIIGGASDAKIKALEKEKSLTISSLQVQLNAVNELAEKTGETDELRLQRAQLINQINQTSLEFENKIADTRKERDDRNFENQLAQITTIKEIRSETAINQLDTANKLLDFEQQYVELTAKRSVDNLSIGTTLQRQTETRQIELKQVEDIYKIEVQRLKNNLELTKIGLNQTKTALKTELAETERNLKKITSLRKDQIDEVRLKELNTQKANLDSRIANVTAQEQQAQLIYEKSLKLLEIKFNDTTNNIKNAAGKAGKDIANALLDATNVPTDPKKVAEKQLDNFNKNIEAIKGLTSEASNLINGIYDLANQRLDNQLTKINAAKEVAQAELETLNNEITDIDNRIKVLNDEAKEASGQRADFLNAQLERELSNREKVQNQIDAQTSSIKSLESQEQKLAQEREKNARQQARIQALAIVAQSALSLAQAVGAVTTTASETGIGAVVAVPAVLGVIAAGIATVTSLIGAAKTFENGGLLEGASHDNGGIKGTGSFSNIEVEGGEYIVNKRATKQFLPLLESINKYQNGGILSPSSFEPITPAMPVIQLGIVDVVQGLNRVNVIDNLSSI